MKQENNKIKTEFKPSKPNWKSTDGNCAVWAKADGSLNIKVGGLNFKCYGPFDLEDKKKAK